VRPANAHFQTIKTNQMKNQITNKKQLFTIEDRFLLKQFLEREDYTFFVLNENMVSIYLPSANNLLTMYDRYNKFIAPYLISNYENTTSNT
jgi:hypothetical protein